MTNPVDLQSIKKDSTDKRIVIENLNTPSKDLCMPKILKGL